MIHENAQSIKGVKKDAINTETDGHFGTVAGNTRYAGGPANLDALVAFTLRDGELNIRGARGQEMVSRDDVAPEGGAGTEKKHSAPDSLCVWLPTANLHSDPRRKR